MSEVKTYFPLNNKIYGKTDTIFGRIQSSNQYIYFDDKYVSLSVIDNYLKYSSDGLAWTNMLLIPSITFPAAVHTALRMDGTNLVIGYLFKNGANIEIKIRTYTDISTFTENTYSYEVYNAGSQYRLVDIFKLGTTWYALLPQPNDNAYLHIRDVSAGTSISQTFYVVQTISKGYIDSDTNEYYLVGLFRNTASTSQLYSRLYSYSAGSSSMTERFEWDATAQGKYPNHATVIKKSNRLVIISNDFYGSNSYLRYINDYLEWDSSKSHILDFNNLSHLTIIKKDDSTNEMFRLFGRIEDTIQYWKFGKSGDIYKTEKVILSSTNPNYPSFGIGDLSFFAEPIGSPPVSPILEMSYLDQDQIVELDYNAVTDEFEATYNTLEIEFVRMSSKLFREHICRFSIPIDSNYIINRGELITLYEKIGSVYSELISGIYDYEESEPDIGKYSIHDGMKFDLARLRTINVTNKSHEKLNEILETSDFINGTISDSSFSNWTLRGTDDSTAEILELISNNENRVVLFDRNKTMTFISDPLAGTAVLSLNYENMNNPLVENRSYQLSVVNLQGKWNGTDYLRSTWVTNEPDIPSYHILDDNYPLIDNQTDLDNLASNIGSQLKNQVKLIKIEVSEINYIPCGSVIQICYPIKKIGTTDSLGNPVTYDKFIVEQSAESEYGDIYLEALSAFVFTSPTEQVEVLPIKNKQIITKIAQDGNLNQININDRFKVNSDGIPYTNEWNEGNIFPKFILRGSFSYPEYLYVCSLPISSGGTYDLVYLEIYGQDYTENLVKQTYMFMNRGGFDYQWKWEGKSFGTNDPLLVAYNVSGRIDIYIKNNETYSSFAVKGLGWSINISKSNTEQKNLVIGEDTFRNNLFSTSTPSGTLVFDASNLTTYPTNWKSSMDKNPKIPFVLTTNRGGDASYNGIGMILLANNSVYCTWTGLVTDELDLSVTRKIIVAYAWVTSPAGDVSASSTNGEIRWQHVADGGSLLTYTSSTNSWTDAAIHILKYHEISISGGTLAEGETIGARIYGNSTTGIYIAAVWLE